MRRRYLLVSLLLVSVVPVYAQDLKSPYYRRFEIGWDVFTYLQVDEICSAQFVCRTKIRSLVFAEGSTIGTTWFRRQSTRIILVLLLCENRKAFQPFGDSAGNHLYQSTLPPSFGASAQQVRLTGWIELLAGEST
jgi:hypothetical protein